MMNILIVDDQKEVVDGMAGNLHWQQLGIDKVFCGYNAGDAREILVREKVDILLCDIEMPCETGLSLVKWMRGEGFETECIFLTSHAEFDYAKEAVSLGSFDYILQPARYEEIEAVIRKAVHKCKQGRKLQALKRSQEYNDQLRDLQLDTYLERICLNSEQSKHYLRRMTLLVYDRDLSDALESIAMMEIVGWRQGKIQWEENLIRVSINNIVGELFEEVNKKVILTKHSAGKYILFIFNETFSEIELGGKQLEKYSILGSEWVDFQTAVYYMPVSNSDSLVSMVAALENIAVQNIMKEQGFIHVREYQEEIRTKKISLLNIKRWQSLIESGDIDVIEQSVSTFFDNPGHRRDYTTLKSAHDALMQAVFAILSEKGISSDDFFDQSYRMTEFAEAYRTYEELLCAIAYIKKQEKVLINSIAIEDKNEDLFRQITDYIQENLEQKLTRESIAEHVHLNEDYLSRYFKKKTGMQLKEYIMQEKINYACELLNTTKLPVSAVALKTGFNSFPHFSQAFKKVKGISPTQFKQDLPRRTI